MERIKDVANQNLSWWDEWNVMLEDAARKARQSIEQEKLKDKARRRTE